MDIDVWKRKSINRMVKGLVRRDEWTILRVRAKLCGMPEYYAKTGW